MRIRSILLVAVLTAAFLLACRSTSSSFSGTTTPTSVVTVIPAANATRTPTPPVTGTATLASICLKAAGIPNIEYPYPSTDDGVPYRSLPEPGTNNVYTGHVVLGPKFIGSLRLMNLAITNEAQAPLAVRESDFAFTSISRGTPMRFGFYELTSGPWAGRADIAPGGILRVNVSIDGEPGDVKATWQIKGNLGAVDIPVLQSVPVSTPRPQSPADDCSATVISSKTTPVP